MTTEGLFNQTAKMNRDNAVHTNRLFIPYCLWTRVKVGEYLICLPYQRSPYAYLHLFGTRSKLILAPRFVRCNINLGRVEREYRVFCRPHSADVQLGRPVFRSYSGRFAFASV